MKIRAQGGDECLMKVIKNPVTDYFPTGAHVFGTSVTGPLVEPLGFVSVLTEKASRNDAYVFILGAFAHGHLDVDYVESMVSFSQYPVRVV